MDTTIRDETLRKKAIAAYRDRTEEERRKEEAALRERGEEQRLDYIEDAGKLLGRAQNLLGMEFTTADFVPVPDDAFDGNAPSPPVPTLLVCGLRLQKCGSWLRLAEACAKCGKEPVGGSFRMVTKLSDLGELLENPPEARVCDACSVEADEEPATCTAGGCDQPATDHIYGDLVCRKHLALWSA